MFYGLQEMLCHPDDLKIWANRPRKDGANDTPYRPGQIKRNRQVMAVARLSAIVRSDHEDVDNLVGRRLDDDNPVVSEHEVFVAPVMASAILTFLQ